MRVLRAGYELAQRYHEEALRVFQQIGHKGMMAVMTSEIAHTQRAMGNYTDARKTYQETIRVFQDPGIALLWPTSWNVLR